MIEVTCAIIIEQGHILVTQRSESMAHPLKWEFPGGKVEEGESAGSCVIREIREELGLEIRVDRQLRHIEYSYETYSVRLIPFICSIEKGSIELTEHKAFRWMPQKDLEELDWLEADVDLIKQIVRGA